MNLHQAMGKKLFNILDEHNLVTEEYMFIGTDGWMLEPDLEEQGLMDFVDGYIGVIPGSISMLTEDQYRNLFKLKEDDDISIYKAAVEKESRISELMNGRKGHNTLTKYGYDAAFAAVYALDIFKQMHGLEVLFDGDCQDRVSSLGDLKKNLQPTQQKLRDILIHNVSFVGATGPVSFDNNGDRKGGCFMYGVIDKYDGIQIFGAKCGNKYFIDNKIWSPSSSYSINESMTSSDHREQAINMESDGVDIDHQLLWISIFFLIGSMINCATFIAWKYFGSKKGNQDPDYSTSTANSDGKDERDLTNSTDASHSHVSSDRQDTLIIHVHE